MHYWNTMYSTQGRIYGRHPSELAKWAVHKGILGTGRRLIEIGCGTGRNSIFFAKEGLEVTGVDFSAVALEMASKDSKEEQVTVGWVAGDITNLRAVLESGAFHAAFSNFCLHLLDAEERAAVVQEVHRVLADGGVFVVSILSTEDADYGKGAEIAYNTFELEPGKPHHFFTREEVEALFMAFDILHLEQTDELEVIVSTTRKTRFWRLAARKGHYEGFEQARAFDEGGDANG